MSEGNCKKCKAWVSGAWRFCQNCGEHLGATRENPYLPEEYAEILESALLIGSGAPGVDRE